jgi:sarcosine oxidase
VKVGVVGLGAVGLSVCWRLAASGINVLGFDARSPNHKYGSSHGDSRIIRLTPGEGASYVRLAGLAAEGWKELEADVRAPLIRWTGAVIAGPLGSSFVKASSELGTRSRRVVDSAELKQLTGNEFSLPKGWTAIWQPDAGVIQAERALSTVSELAIKNGASLYRNSYVETPVTGRKLRVNGTWREFDRVVIAAGPWIGELSSVMSKYTWATRKALAWFRHARRHAIKLPAICLDDDLGTYAMPTSDGLCKIGLDAVGERISNLQCVPDLTVRDVAPNVEMARRYFHALDPEPARMERCLYTMTSDKNFLITARQHDVLLMSCCSGHGFKYMPEYGRIALCWIKGENHFALKDFDLGATRVQPV